MRFVPVKSEENQAVLGGLQCSNVLTRYRPSNQNAAI